MASSTDTQFLVGSVYILQWQHKNLSLTMKNGVQIILLVSTEGIV